MPKKRSVQFRELKTFDDVFEFGPAVSASLAAQGLSTDGIEKLRWLTQIYLYQSRYTGSIPTPSQVKSFLKKLKKDSAALAQFLAQAGDEVARSLGLKASSLQRLSQDLLQVSDAANRACLRKDGYLKKFGKPKTSNWILATAVHEVLEQDGKPICERGNRALRLNVLDTLVNYLMDSNSHSFEIYEPLPTEDVREKLLDEAITAWKTNPDQRLLQ